MRTGFCNFMLVTIIFLTIVSCGSRNENSKTVDAPNNNSILGEWQAMWTMNDPSLQAEDPNNLKVSGRMNFMDSSHVEITTFGFDGNLIMSDTTTNILNWRMEDKILRFIDTNDVQGIPYVIEEMKENEIQLTIMGDIKLKLWR